MIVEIIERTPSAPKHSRWRNGRAPTARGSELGAELTVDATLFARPRPPMIAGKGLSGSCVVAMRLRFAISLIVLAFFLVDTANAELKSTDPSVVCAYMNDVGLVTRGWKNQYENVFACLSPYKELGAGFPLANNVAYYVEGDRTSVRQVKLVLNVNDRKTANAAHEELLKAAEALSLKAAGENLPQTLKYAIKAGKNATAKVGSLSINVAHDNWLSNKGYGITVLIR